MKVLYKYTDIQLGFAPLYKNFDDLNLVYQLFISSGVEDTLGNI